MVITACGLHFPLTYAWKRRDIQFMNKVGAEFLNTTLRVSLCATDVNRNFGIAFFFVKHKRETILNVKTHGIAVLTKINE
jgi:hypothetical protein